MVEIFVYFVLKSITRKLKLTNISLHNNVNVFYVTMLSCTNIKIRKFSLYENCTTENYLLLRCVYLYINYVKPCIIMLDKLSTDVVVLEFQTLVDKCWCLFSLSDCPLELLLYKQPHVYCLRHFLQKIWLRWLRSYSIA